jgi:serine O-acetyltransferase
MIKDRLDYIHYLRTDAIANGWQNSSFMAKVKDFFLPNYLKQFHIQLRKVEYYKNCKKGFISKVRYVFIVRKFNYLSRINGFTISANCFGPGLSIAHSGSIVVNAKAKIGANCRIHTCVNIGTAKDSDDQVPTIGDNVYIAPGAKIYGKILIADNCVIGANAVVNKSFITKGSKIIGVPAKIIE